MYKRQGDRNGNALDDAFFPNFRVLFQKPAEHFHCGIQDKSNQKADDKRHQDVQNTFDPGNGLIQRNNSLKDHGGDGDDEMCI